MRGSRNAEAIIHTSVDDCRVSILHWEKRDYPELERALEMSLELGQKTRAQIIGRRLRAMKKEMGQ